MMKRIVLAAVAVGLGWLYLWAVAVATSYAAALQIPPWWTPLFAASSNAILAWMVLVHTFAVLFVSLPFALAIYFLYERTGIWVAVAITVAMYSLTTLPTVARFIGTSPLRIQMVRIFDAVKLVGVLPALVWGIGALLSKLPHRAQHEP
jgi:hypothetical protein